MNTYTLVYNYNKFVFKDVRHYIKMLTFIYFIRLKKSSYFKNNINKVKDI